ncbi:MAG: hypothetical protein ACYDDQ_05845 [Vulcanimicrobiaceae bacterium]
MHSFAQAQDLPLKTDADYGRFVDASIVGAARQRAIYLLEFMPPGMRGDFVEIHADGTVTSNRADLPAMVHFILNAAPLTKARASSAQTHLVTPMEYPPSSASGGLYIRNYSYQGINAAFGIATPPCDVQLPNSGDSGDMYFNAWSPNTVGSQTDAGVGSNEYPGRDSTASDVFPFVNSAGWDPHQASGQFVNAYESWSCGQPLVIVYGTLPYPNTGTSMLAVGPPDYDPSQFQLPPATVTLQNPAWTFFNTPASLDPAQNDGAQSGTYDGIPSNCMGCAVAQMFTIAEPNGADGSCYGFCTGNGQYDGLWDEVIMGELVSPCGPNSFGLSNPCTIEYESLGDWYNGEYTCDACNYAIDMPNDQQAAEGLSDPSYSSQSIHTRSTAVNSKLQASNLPIAPSFACTPDSYGYCAVQMSRVETGSCEINSPSRPYYVYAYTTTYDIFKKITMLELQETATQHESISSQPCALTTSWFPNNPATYYNDPNLP